MSIYSMRPQPPTHFGPNPDVTKAGHRPAPAMPDKQELDTLLRAGPADASRTRQPDRPGGPPRMQVGSTPQSSPEVLVKLQKIGHLLSRDRLVEMLREPNSTHTTQHLKELRELLSESSLKTLTQDPAELKELRAGIGKVLSHKNMHAIQRQAAVVHLAHLTPDRIRERTSGIDPDTSFAASLQIDKELRDEDVNISQRSRQSAPLCKNLIQTGLQVCKKNNAEPEEPKTKPEVLVKLRKIGDLLSRASLLKMLREPNAKQTEQRASELRELLSEASLKTLTDDPVEQKQLRAGINRVLSKTNIEAMQREAGVDPGTELPVKPSPERTPKSPEVKVNPPTESVPKTFSFNSTAESARAAPKEVIGFSSGTDKIDLTGIRTQLGDKPLEIVEQLSGASGEIQLHYSPGPNTSVVVVSAHQGEPPFVLKVFGKVTNNDLRT